MLHGDKVDSSFKVKVADVAARLGIDVDWLMAVIELETAGTFSPSITNELGYTGLIQFGNAAAVDLGTTTAELRRMTAVEQLEYVHDYLKRYKSRIRCYVDLYLAIFFPAAIGKSYDYVLETSYLSASRVAKNNPLFDVNKDGKITVEEVEKKLLDRVPNIIKDKFVKKKITFGLYTLIVSLMVGSFVFFVFRKSLGWS